MKIARLMIRGALLIVSRVIRYNHDLFFGIFDQAQFDPAVGRTVSLAEGDCSRAAKEALRGLRYWTQRPQRGPVRAMPGEVSDVVMGICNELATFGQWVAEISTADGKKCLRVSEEFARGSRYFLAALVAPTRLVIVVVRSMRGAWPRTMLTLAFTGLSRVRQLTPLRTNWVSDLPKVVFFSHG